MLDCNTMKKLIGNSIFSVSFIKKNGELRKLTGRFGVKKGVTGKGQKYTPKNFNYLTVYDIKKEAFRTINFNTITEITFKGKKYKVETND